MSRIKIIIVFLLTLLVLSLLLVFSHEKPETTPETTHAPNEEAPTSASIPDDAPSFAHSETPQPKEQSSAQDLIKQRLDSHLRQNTPHAWSSVLSVGRQIAMRHHSRASVQLHGYRIIGIEMLYNRNTEQIRMDAPSWMFRSPVPQDFPRYNVSLLREHIESHFKQQAQCELEHMGEPEALWDTINTQELTPILWVELQYFCEKQNHRHREVWLFHAEDLSHIRSIQRTR